MEKGAGVVELGPIFQHILDEVTQYFADEEKIMANIGYEKLDVLKEMHKSLLETAQSIAREVELNATNQSPENLLTVLTSLILTHIEADDMVIKKAVHKGLKLD